MAQISQQSNALVALVEGQRAVIGRMLHPALAEQSERLVEFALAAIRNPKIAECTPDSLIQALHTSAKCGLMPDGVEGAIVPRRNKGIAIAQFEPMYQGLVKAYLRGGRVSQVWADVILKGEDYKVQAGHDPRIEHTPDITRDRSNWDELLCAYAVARFPDGHKVHMIVPKAELIRLRENAASQNGPWSTHPVAMAWKTPLKRLRKLVPLEPELSLTLAQQEAEEGVRDIEGEVVQPRATTLEQVVGADKPQIAPEVWHYEVRIDERNQKWDEWKGQTTGSSNPKLAQLTWEGLSALDTKSDVVPIMEGMLKEAALRQSEKGTVGDQFQRAAVAWELRRKRLIAAELEKEKQAEGW